MNRKKANQTATIAMLFAAMIIIEIISQMIFQTFPLPIKPTVTFVPVIIAAILFGPRIGAGLGRGMGVMSVIRNSIIIGPSSYLFSPLAPGGSLLSLVIAILPRVLIGIVPYFLAKWLSKHPIGLLIAGASGALTNTIFVVTGAFFLFPNFLNGDGQRLIGAIVSTLSLIEIIIAALLTALMVPRLEKFKKS